MKIDNVLHHPRSKSQHSSKGGEIVKHFLCSFVDTFFVEVEGKHDKTAKNNCNKLQDRDDGMTHQELGLGIAATKSSKRLDFCNVELFLPLEVSKQTTVSTWLHMLHKHSHAAHVNAPLKLAVAVEFHALQANRERSCHFVIFGMLRFDIYAVRNANAAASSF